MSWFLLWLAIAQVCGATLIPITASAGITHPDSLREVTFAYQDLNYEQVQVAGSFTNWVRIPLVKTNRQWSVTLEIPTGLQHYRFTVTDTEETWNAIDPENSAAMNHAEFGWVSVLDFDVSLESDHEEMDRDAREDRRQYKKRIKHELSLGQPDIGSGSYHRVDGLTLGMALKHIGTTDSFEPSARAQISYGFSSGRASAGLTILQPLIPRAFLGLKVTLYDRTDYSDQTGIENLENSLAAFFLHEDFRDYYRNKGVRGSLVFKLAAWLRLEAGLLSEEHYALSAPSVWSVRKGDFGPNPAADEGSLNSLLAQLRIGGRDNHVHLSYEHSSPGLLGGSFDFEQFTATARGNLQLSSRSGFDARLKAGRNFQGRLPVQRQYVLGGLGTVRGYEYQSLLIRNAAAPPGAPAPHGGQNMFLGNLEYSFELASWLGMALFYDAGMAWEDRETTPNLNQLKTSGGLGFKPGNADWFRIDMIQKLDDRDSKPVYQIRLGRVF